MKGHVSIHPHSFSLSHALNVALHHVARWYQLGRQRRQLASLSDEALHDLGLSRADTLQEVERPFWDDPLRK
ncbi:DUF1127 domain-containing protein [Pseudomonas entomophila]|uniref:DUF1127 domain-containing protein n=1 Tax=Pseudomonas entomophila TaxID=312306 RepID=UPI0023D8012C|nr:DUF1127 domain-containing protein [Pseudomonas entomophila]MDF0732611.1 DUF1127 domain-containing protein [Pseudomonas entomophila]